MRSKKHIVNLVFNELQKHKGKTITSKQIADKINLSPNQVGMILSYRFKNQFLDVTGVKATKHNKRAMKLYTVRI